MAFEQHNYFLGGGGRGHRRILIKKIVFRSQKHS
jgi:hypothetical protein